MTLFQGSLDKFAEKKCIISHRVHMESFPVQLAPELEIPGTWRGTREDFHGSFPWICAQLHTFTADIPWTHPGDSASEPVPSTSPKFRASTRAPGDCCLRIPCFKRCCKKHLHVLTPYSALYCSSGLLVSFLGTTMILPTSHPDYAY